MAWRPHNYLEGGVLDNRIPGKVTGTMYFHGVDQPVKFDLVGDFHRDIRGKRILLFGMADCEDEAEARSYMSGLALQQTGKAGNITAGLEPQDYGDCPYIEWHSERNGRVVIELMPDQLVVERTPLPADVQWPLSCEEQYELMFNFLMGL